MVICQICQEKPANKKGSHIVPHFLIKRIVNVDSDNGRDKELSLTFTNFASTTFFGRSILPEKLESVFGELNHDFDSIIENNKSSDVVDNYFCTDCEDNLAQIENVYAKSLSVRSNSDLSQEFCQNPSISFLFWISILWRLSIQFGSGFKLKLKDEKKLGRLIKKYLQNDIEKISFDSNDQELKNIGYKILRAPNFSEKNSTVMFWEAEYTRPYTIMIDEYILFFYFKKSHVNSMILYFHDTEELKMAAKFNSPFEKETILKVDDNEYETIITRIINSHAKNKNDHLEWVLKNVFEKFLREKDQKVLNKLKNKIITKINSSNIPIGKKYSFENQTQIIYDTISEHYGSKKD